MKHKRSRFAEAWWCAEEGHVHEKVFSYVRTVERRQSDYYDRFLLYEAHYDPNGPTTQAIGAGYLQRLRGIKENVIAMSVDTVCASIAATEIRARFMTDGADWSTQRRARDLELYAEEMGKLTDVGEACRTAFFECAKKGTGVIKVYADQDKRLRVDAIPVENIIVDDRECANGASPRQLHYRQADFDCDALCQQFPDHAEWIEKARGQNLPGWHSARFGYDATRNDVYVIESWRLPMGKKPADWDELDADERAASGYMPGRHTITVTGRDLLDEEWHKPHFGMVEVRYYKRTGSWYGGALTDRNIGHQRVLDRRNHQRDRQLDYAVPTWFVSHIDANVRIQQTQAGNIVPIKGDKPTAIVPTVIGSEIANDRMDARASAIEEIGLPAIATRGVKAPGIESGAALREFKDQTSQRFAMQEKAFGRLWIGATTLILDVCKDLGEDAPEMSKQSRFGPRRLRWRDVDMDDVKVQIAAASTLARTPAGRVQTVLELTQAGALNVDELRKLLDHPDLKRTNSLYTASMEAIEHDFEHIKNGFYVIPEPFVNLQMALKYAQCEYLIERENGAPEEVLEGLRAYAVTAANMLSPPANMNAPAPPTDPAIGGALPPGTPLSGMDGAMPLPPQATPQQVPSAAPPTLPAGTGPQAA